MLLPEVVVRTLAVVGYVRHALLPDVGGVAPGAVGLVVELDPLPFPQAPATAARAITAASGANRKRDIARPLLWASEDLMRGGAEFFQPRSLIQFASRRGRC